MAGMILPMGCFSQVTMERLRFTTGMIAVGGITEVTIRDCVFMRHC